MKKSNEMMRPFNKEKRKEFSAHMCSRNETKGDESDIFTPMSLKGISECMNPGITDKVYFPKIEQKITVDPNNPDCLHTFWMAGFLHHEKDENENLVSVIE